VELRLFDGTLNNIISEIVSLPVKFPSSECMTLDFYVTPLDSCCSLVLGHSLWNFDDDCRIAFNTLKQAFTSTPILMHWVPDAQLVVETDASDYALAAILSIMTKDSEIYPITFHSRTFSTLELNYDIHNKELLAIFKAFKIWRHYLEGFTSPIDIVTDYKNLEYFSTTKILTRRQARWSEYLSQFNLVIHFCPRRLGTKLNTLTR